MNGKLPRASYMCRSPQAGLSPFDTFVRLVVDGLIYLAHPMLVVSFRRRLGYWPRPALPLRYHEKYLWRKLFDHDPRHVELTDKLAAKAYVRNRWPDIRVAELYWQGTDPDQIPDEILSGACAIKASHGSAMNVFVEGGVVDRKELATLARRWLRRVYGRRHHEWAYSRIRPRLFAEQLMTKNGTPVRPDYKLYVTGGVVRYAYLNFDRSLDTVHEAVLDRDGRSRQVPIESGTTGMVLDRPAHWERLVSAAERMGADFDCVRCDLHEIDGEIWFSEFTFYSAAGFAWVDDAELISALNGAWDITRSWFLSTPRTGLAGIYARFLRSWLEPGEGEPNDAAIPVRDTACREGGQGLSSISTRSRYSTNPRARGNASTASGPAPGSGT